MKKSKTKKPRYELEIAGVAKQFKRETDNVQESFNEFVKELEIDLLANGAVFILKESGKTAQVTLTSRRMRLFKNNENTRQLTEQYLQDQLVSQI